MMFQYQCGLWFSGVSGIGDVIVSVWIVVV